MGTLVRISILLALLLSFLCYSSKQNSLSEEVIILHSNRSCDKYITEADLSSSYVAVTNGSLETFHNQPIVTILHIQSLNTLLIYLSQVNQLLEHHEAIGWKHTIVFVVSSQSNELYIEMLKNISFSSVCNFDINSEVFLIFQTPEFTEAYEIYTVKEELYVKTVSVRFNMGLELEISDTGIQRRRDLQGILINGVTQDDPTLELVATFKEVNGVTKFHTGVSVAYFEMMAEGLNFSMGAVKGTGWISQAPDGSLEGMAKQLQSGEADILIAFSELLPYRLNGLRFIHPYYRGSVKAFFQQPPPSEIRNIFFQPLQSELWISLFALWLFVVMSLKYIYEFKVKFLKGQTVPDDLVQIQNPDQLIADDAFMWGVSSACGQGWHTSPQCGLMKVIMLSGLVTFIFTFTAYSAAIVTTLSVFLAPIKTWTDLVNSGFKIYGDSLLQSSASITNKSLRPNIFVPNNQTAIGVTQALKWFSTNDPIAFISVSDQFYQISSKSNYTTEFICQRVSKVSIEGNLKIKGGMSITKSSPFKKLFNYQTILIQERGLDARLSYQYSSQYTPNCSDKQNNFDTYILGINDVFTAFAILLSGFIASAVILLGEKAGLTRKHLCQSRIFRIRITPVYAKANVYLPLVGYVKRNWPSCQLLSLKSPKPPCFFKNSKLNEKL